MTPHAITPPLTDGTGSPEPKSPSVEANHSNDEYRAVSNVLPSTPVDCLHDLICVGFGPASLAIAVALHDHVEANPGITPPKVAFLEKQNDFAWHSGMQIPGATMQISWIKDLATVRNPRSHFTFLNYLHECGRLMRFSNLGTFLPQRVEYEAYMKWAASHFKHLAAYSQEGLEILPRRPQGIDSTVEHWLVRSRNLRTGEIEERLSRHVVLSLGGRPLIPSYLPQSNPRVIHSSQFMYKHSAVLPDRSASYTILVIGAGQSAAETFHHLYSQYPNAKVRLLVRGAALKPSDDSPFVNETFNPEHVDDVFATEASTRLTDLMGDKATNYGVVRLELLEEIYANMYEESVRHPQRREEELRKRILPFREVTGVETVGKSGRLKVQVRNAEALHKRSLNPGSSIDEIDADALIVAAGYQRNAHEELMAGLKDLMPAKNINGDKWGVRRDYSVEFADGVVSKDSGVWLQGCNENTHGLSDTLLSILSVRGGEIVDSIFGA